VCKPEALCDAGRDPHRPVDSRRDETVDVLRSGESSDPAFILGGQDRAPIRVTEAWSGGIPIDRDDVQTAPARSGQRAQLSGPRP
jgi:hypothetical protein